MKFVICGGGTAGHVKPALAVADAVASRVPGAEVLYFGREGGEEVFPVKQRKYRTFLFPLCGLAGFSKKTVRALILAIRATREAKKVLARERPDFVFGTGGYVSYPVMRAAVKCRIPTYLHESNAVPGITSRLLAKRCTAVFSGTESGFGEAVGTPVDRAFFTLDKKRARRGLGIPEGTFFLLSFGGSLGAERCNDAVLKMMETYSSKQRDFLHVHATGRRYYERVMREKPAFLQKSGRCILLPYIDRMPEYLAAADLVITRSGASTLAEIGAVGVPALLIPSPNVTNDHQTKNAERLTRVGAAKILPESENLADRLVSAVDVLRRVPSERVRLGQNAKKHFGADAAALIAKRILEKKT